MLAIIDTKISLWLEWAMSMKLFGADDSTIMYTWAVRKVMHCFLKYVRKYHILQFSSNISRQILSRKHFTHILLNSKRDSSPSKESMGSLPTTKYSNNNLSQLTKENIDYELSRFFQEDICDSRSWRSKII